MLTVYWLDYPQSGDGSAVSLQLITVGTRHCRLLYHSGATGIDITHETKILSVS